MSSRLVYQSSLCSQFERFGHDLPWVRLAKLCTFKLPSPSCGRSRHDFTRYGAAVEQFGDVGMVQTRQYLRAQIG